MLQNIARKNKSRLLFCSSRLVVAAVLFLAVASPALALYKYLPDPNKLPQTIHQIQSTCPDTDKVESYEDLGVKSYTVDVFCPTTCCPGCPSCIMAGQKIGTLDFEYSPFKGDLGGVSKGAGGAIIRGGFILAAGLALCPDYTLRWLQYYEATGYWNGEHIDGDPENPLDPLYPNHKIEGVTAPLFDAAAAQFKDGAFTVEFESALVCWKPGTTEICVIGSFFWGYENVIGPPTSVTGKYPQGWSFGLGPSFKEQFDEEYKDKGWTLVDGCCIIPEPGTMIIFVLGGLLAVSRRRRAA